MKVLITGGAGFIGTHLAAALRGRGHPVSIFDNYDPQVHGRVKGKKKQSVLDSPALKRAVNRADAVVHFAAAVGVGQSQYQIKHYVDTNIGGTANLLEILASRKKPLKKLLVAGSMSAYGEGAYLCRKCGRVRPVLRTPAVVRGKRWDPACPNCAGALRPTGTSEKDPFICSSIYAVTKMTQEELVMNYGTAYGVATTALRFFNVYGPGQSLSNPYTGVAAIFMSRIKNGQPPGIFEDGGQTRDFISVHDIVQACMLSLTRKAANNRVFNVGTGKATSVLELAERLVRIFGASVKPKTFGTFRKGDIRHCYADNALICDVLGFKPRVDLDSGMRELIEWAHGVRAVDTFEKAHRELKERKLA